MRPHRALIAALAVTVIGLLGWLLPPLSELSGQTFPPGQREVAEAPGPSGVVVGLGDSVMSGSQCDCVPFLDGYAQDLSTKTDHPHSPANLGVNGLTAEDLWTSVRTDPVTRAAISGATVIVITVGANDLSAAADTFESIGECDQECIQRSVDPMARALSDVLDVVHTLRPAGTPILVTTYWNVYAVGPGPEAEMGSGWAEFSQAMTAEANLAIARTTASHEDILVDLVPAFGPPSDQLALLIEDGDHPNAKGNAVIAHALLTATPT